MEKSFKPRIEWIDTVKCIGLFLVILGHMPSLPKIIIYFIFSFHMPLFFIISGFLYKSKSTKTIIRKKTKTLFYPYFLYSIAFILINFFVFNDFHNLLNSFIKVLIGQGGIDVLWFFISLFWVEIIYSILDNSIIKQFKIIIILLIVSLGYLSTFAISIDLFKISTSLVALGFYALGDNLKKINYDRLINNKLIIFSCLCIYIITTLLNINLYNGVMDINYGVYRNLLYSYLSGICGSLLVFSFAYKLNKCIMINCISKYLNYIGRNTLWFYPLMAYLPVLFEQILILKFNYNSSFLIKINLKIISFILIIVIININKPINNLLSTKSVNNKMNFK